MSDNILTNMEKYVKLITYLKRTVPITDGIEWGEPLGN